MMTHVGMVELTSRLHTTPWGDGLTMCAKNKWIVWAQRVEPRYAEAVLGGGSASTHEDRSIHTAVAAVL